jgi:hypothetical protein
LLFFDAELLMRRVLPTLLLIGCGDFGLTEVSSIDGDETLVNIEPQGQIRFDEASPHGNSVSEEIDVEAIGTGNVTIEDAWIESSTAGVFYTAGDLPFPRTIEEGDSFPMTVRFAPVSAGTFHATLVVETTSGAVLERQMLGQGCRDNDADGRC